MIKIEFKIKKGKKSFNFTYEKEKVSYGFDNDNLKEIIEDVCKIVKTPRKNISITNIYYSK